jgi:hypothetical protein
VSSNVVAISELTNSQANLKKMFAGMRYSVTLQTALITQVVAKSNYVEHISILDVTLQHNWWYTFYDLANEGHCPLKAMDIPYNLQLH